MLHGKNPRESAAPSDQQRDLLLERLGHRLDQEGWLRLVEAGSRSQLRNKEAVTERFLTLVAQALRPPKARTTPRLVSGTLEPASG